MNENQPIEKFLETASAGLAGDRELQLDVQAELRSHLEERLRDAEDAGLKGTAAEAKALAMMGEPLELADKLATANRPRMRLRAWIRHTLRWALIPLAVLIAVVCAWQPVKNSIWTLKVEIDNTCFINPYFRDWSIWKTLLAGNLRPSIPPKATPEQCLLLDSMRFNSFYFELDRIMSKQRKEFFPKARTLWEKSPTNQAYLHNCFSKLILSGLASKNQEERNRYFAQSEDLIMALKSYDPDNARFDYLLAWIDMEAACRVDFVRKPPPASLEPYNPFAPDSSEPDTGFNGTLVIYDRARLDQAMAHLRTALQKTVLRTHHGEAELECLRILGKPTSIAESSLQIGLINNVCDVDSIWLPKLAMNAPFYGELLIKEGRKEEAEIFLNAWKRIMTHLAHSDARGLNESRMMANMSYTGRENSNLYERLGDLDKAAKARAEYEALWASIYGSTRDRTLDFPEKQTHLRWALLARCGVDAVSLQTMTMKNVQFADFFDAEAMECSRHQEYLLADSLMIGVISILIMVTMLGCLVVTLWFRFWRKSAPLLLLPSLMETMCISLGGVLLPLLVYQLLVRLLPCAGRGYGIFYVWPKYLAGVICLLVAMGWLTATLSAYFLRRRCRQLGVATPIKSHWGWLAAAGSLLVLQIVFFCIPESEIQTVLDPSRWPLLPAVALLALTLFKILFAIPVPPGKHWGWLAAIAMIIGPFSLFYVNHATCNAEQLLLALSVLLGLLALLWLFFVFRRRRQPPVILPFYRGTLVRSLVPVLALSMLFLNLVSAPWYRFEELRLMEQKNAILISPENGCSVFQNRCVEKWNAELQAALEKLGK